MLQSQEIDIELQMARRRLRAARKKFLPREELKKLARTLDSIKVSLAEKEVLVNTKLSQLETEISQIVLEIDDIRVFRKMHSQACKQTAVEERAVDVNVNSMARQMRGAFNERDKLVNELKILQRQEKHERARFVEQMRVLKKESASHETNSQLLLTVSPCFVATCHPPLNLLHAPYVATPPLRCYPPLPCHTPLTLPPPLTVLQPPFLATLLTLLFPHIATPLTLPHTLHQELEQREEDGKRSDYIHFRGVRGKHEARVTKHGYLCTQRERIAAAYAELIRRVGAGAGVMPSDISVLLQPGYMPRDITERFVTLEATVTSLLNLQEVHRNQMEEIQVEIDELSAEADGVEQGHAGVEAEREA